MHSGPRGGDRGDEPHHQSARKLRRYATTLTIFCLCGTGGCLDTAYYNKLQHELQQIRERQDAIRGNQPPPSFSGSSAALDVQETEYLAVSEVATLWFDSKVHIKEVDNRQMPEVPHPTI